MKAVRYAMICVFLSLYTLTHAEQIPVTEHIWEIHKKDAIVQFPYCSISNIKFEERDLENNYHDDYVSQNIDFRVYYHIDEEETRDMIDDISFMRYVKNTTSIEMYRDVKSAIPRQISPKGADWDLTIPAGSTISNRNGYDYMEFEQLGGKIVKVKINRNNGTLWRRDTLDIKYPNGATISLPIEQPGDKCFKRVDVNFNCKVDFVSYKYNNGKPEINGYTFDSGFGLGSGSLNLAFTGKPSDKIHKYTAHYKNEDGSHTIDFEVEIDVYQKNGKVLSSSTTEKRYGENYYEINSASFGEAEAVSEYRYSTQKEPEKWEYKKQNNGVTEEVKDRIIKSANCDITFYR